MTLITLDPRARFSIDKRASELLSGLVERVRQAGPSDWQPDVHVAARFSEKDVLSEIDIGQVSIDGQHTSLEFVHDGKIFSLAGEQYLGLRKVVQSILKSITVRNQIDEHTVESQLRKWVRGRFRGEIEGDFTDCFLSELQEDIRSYQIWVPLERFHVQLPIELQIAQIQPITREFLRKLELSAKDEQGRLIIEKRYARYLGSAAVVFEYVSEKGKAKQVAIDVAERVLAAISMLSPAALCCEFISGVSLWGSRRHKAASIMLFSEDAFVGASAGVVGPVPQTLQLDAGRIAEFSPVIEGLGNLLLMERTNKLAEKVVDALRVYSRAINAHEPVEKLIYMFVALEMLMVKGSEPLQENVSIRIAFLIGSSAADRKEIAGIVKKGYALRSAFIHHGLKIEDTEEADKMLYVAWRTFIKLLSAVHEFDALDKLVDYLDTRKFA